MLDESFAEMLREAFLASYRTRARLIEEYFFKGYETIPLTSTKILKNTTEPKILKHRLGVTDAHIRISLSKMPN